MNMLSDSQTGTSKKGRASRKESKADENRFAYKQLPRLDINDEDEENFQIEDLLSSGMLNKSKDNVHEAAPTTCAKNQSQLTGNRMLLQSTLILFHKANHISNLKFKENQLYDPANSKHEELLEQFGRVVLGDIEIEFMKQQDPNTSLKCPGWRRFGFQSDNPRTDFRGAGIIGLRNLKYFCERYQVSMESMIKDQMFFFALSSIQITNFLITFFHLPQDQSRCLPSLLKYKAKRSQLKNFLRLQAQDNRVLGEIHSQALLFSHRFWCKNQKKLHQIKQQDARKGFNFIYSFYMNYIYGQQLMLSASFSHEPMEETFKFVVKLMGFRFEETIEIQSYGEILAQHIFKKKFSGNLSD